MNISYFLMKGYLIALLEVLLFFGASCTMRLYVPDFQDLGLVMYYWFCFTTLTGFWEFTYLTNYDDVAGYAQHLVKEGKSVWLMDFPWYFIRPDLLAKMFYAEYGANADREYQSERKGDFWARLVECSHALCCASFACASVIPSIVDHEKMFRLGMVGMGMQFMNSLLYMGKYIMQCNDPNSCNYNTSKFPVGPWMIDRWFMWVNAFWLLFPTIVIFQYC